MASFHDHPKCFARRPASSPHDRPETLFGLATARALLGHALLPTALANIRAVIVGASVFFGVPPAGAQEVSAFRITPVNTANVFYFHSHAVNCQGLDSGRLAKAATVVVPERPVHGTISVREGIAPVAHCQGRPGYATIVNYTPESGYSGLDMFKLRVLYDLKMRIVSRTINVRVQVGGHGT